jgi:hypothetical protein
VGDEGEPMIYRYIGVTLTVLGALYGAYQFGASVATTQAELTAAVERDAATARAVVLSGQLRDVEVALLAEQGREAEFRTVEVIKHRTIYRDKIIKVPHIIECIDNSGLLDVINASMPTVTTEQAER